MTTRRLMITGKMGSGKSSASTYLEQHYGATRWTRSESMKLLAHALADQVGDPEALLASLLPDVAQRDEVRGKLLAYIAGYAPESGKPRRLYQDVAQIVMDTVPLAFERELHERMTIAERGGTRFSLIDDVRSAEAFTFFSEHGYSSLRIDASERVRRTRMLARDGALPREAAFAHPSEVALDAHSHDHALINDGDDASVLTDALDGVMGQLGLKPLGATSTREGDVDARRPEPT